MFLNPLRVAACAAFVLCAVHASAAEPVKLAYIGSLSGTMALPALETMKAFQAATELVNSRGGAPGGRQFEIVPYDNKLNAQETLVVLRKAIDDGAQYILAGTSLTAGAISEALLKHNARNPEQTALLLDYNGQDPALTESKCSFWHFRMTAHSDTLVGILVDRIASQPDIHKVYLINPDYSAGQAVERASREFLKAKRPDIEIVGDDMLPLGKVKDFAPYVAKIHASGADAVITNNWGNDLILLMKSSAEAGLKAQFYTVNGTVAGTAAGVGPAGAGRMKSVGGWHINAADATWRKRLVGYKIKFGSTTNMDLILPYRTMDMLAAAMNAAGTTDPVKVAFAMEGMKYNGFTGPTWMRAEDHQIMAPLYILSLAKAGQPPVDYDEESSGYGWKTEAFFEAKDTVPPVKCQMERPAKP
jgi:branched-chain amino acid transport system substrate-binding protein